MLSKLIFTGERASLSDVGGINLARYIFASKRAKGKKVLEIGFGSGYGAYYLGKHGAEKVDAIDVDMRVVDFAKKHYTLKNINYFRASIENFNKLEKYPLTISFEVIEHLKNPKVFLDNVVKSLKKNGIFLVSTPNRIHSSYDGDKPTNPYHVKEYYPDEFVNLLNKYFKKVVLYGIFLKNEEKKREDNIQNTLRWRLAARLARKRWIRRVVNYLPESPKRIFTGERDLNFKPSDFKFSSKNPEKASYVLAVCNK